MGAVKSALSRPVTASEKVMASVAVSPAFSVLSLNVMEETVGLRVSTATGNGADGALVLPDAGSVTVAVTLNVPSPWRAIVAALTVKAIPLFPVNRSSGSGSPS